MELPEAIHHESFVVPAEAVDTNGHVNNVVYVQWMQDVAIRHAEGNGGTPPMTAAGATWVARSHHVVYYSPAFAGDRLAVATWVANVRRARSLRRYRFTDARTGKLLVTGETEWVFVDAVTGRPKSIPPALAACFVLVPPEEEPGA